MCKFLKKIPALPDSQFCIDRHVFAGPSKLTTEKQLQDYVGHLLEEGLSNDKPPWELHVLQSVGHHRDTVTVLRVHQSVADGMALVRVLCHSLADCHVLHIPQARHPIMLYTSFLLFIIWHATT